MKPATVTPTDIHTWKEWRRFRAWELAQQGWAQCAIAAALDVTEGAVSQWLKKARQEGPAALHRRIHPGPPHRLTQDQRAQLPTLLAKGAPAYGFRGDVWTAARITTVIHREFGVRYHPSHVNRLVRALGLSVQQPEVRASQRDPAKVTAWLDEQWPVLEKKPTPRDEPSSGSTNPVSTSCLPGCEPMLPGDTRRS